MVAKVSEALTTGQDVFCYREFSRSMVEQLAPYKKACRFWKGIYHRVPESSSSVSHRSTTAFLVSLTIISDASQTDDMVRHLSKPNFMNKYFGGKKRAELHKELAERLVHVSEDTMFVKLLHGLGLIKAEIPVGAAVSAEAGGEGTMLYSIHPVFSLFCGEKRAKQGISPSPEQRRLPRTCSASRNHFVDYHEERVLEWIQQY